jgi:hypothetical protein
VSGLCDDPVTVYERLRHAQTRTDREVVGYAVVLAGPSTVRSAYMTGDGVVITNDEREAFVGRKAEAAGVMCRLRECGEEFPGMLWRVAFLVPVFEAYKHDRGFPTVFGY